MTTPSPPEYVALLRNALAMMKVARFDLLVVGLPVALFAGRKTALGKVMTGRHEIGDGKVVTVAKAVAVAQPPGTLVHFASTHRRTDTIGSERCLIIDPDLRISGWLVAQGMRLLPKQRHSVNRGCSAATRPALPMR